MKLIVLYLLAVPSRARLQAASVLLGSEGPSHPGPRLVRGVYALTSQANRHRLRRLASNRLVQHAGALAMLAGFAYRPVLAMRSLGEQAKVHGRRHLLTALRVCSSRCLDRGQADRFPVRPWTGRGQLAQPGKASHVRSRLLRRAAFNTGSSSPRRYQRSCSWSVVTNSCHARNHQRALAWLMRTWLWFHRLFANFGRRWPRAGGQARRSVLAPDHRTARRDGGFGSASGKLALGDVIVVTAGRLIRPAAGHRGITSVDGPDHRVSASHPRVSGTAPRSPAARACCPIKSWCASRRSLARASSTA
jgi:hypothetical protein